MIDKNDFGELQKKMRAFDEQRDKLIRDSRDVILFSKQVIYSIHRTDLEKAELLIPKMKKSLEALKELTKNHPELYYSANYRIAVQEFVEAMAFYFVIKEKRLPTHKELDADYESYLNGICDLAGELVRKAINSAIAKDYKTALEIKDFVSELYGEMMLFDFRGTGRKKFDSIKYDLKKLEDVALSISQK